MSNEKFKVKFGLAVGDTAATIDATTGEVIAALNNDGQVKIGKGSGTNGRIDVGNRDRLVAGSPFIDFNSSVNAIDFDVRLIASGGSGTDGQGTLTAYAASIVTTGTLDVQGGTITNSTGALSITTGASNGNITLTPNGTGDVILSTDTVQVGDSNATATITTNGTGNLVLNTNNGTNAGTLTLANGANGVITLDPNGTGNVAVTFANGGNLTNDRNYVFGAIRNATTAGIGDIWALNVTGTVQPNRGVNLDNSADTTKMPATVLRTYNSTSTNRGFLVFEKARGTAASPTAVQSGDIFGSIIASGCNGAGTFINDTTTAAPVIVNFSAAENFVSNTNIGGSLSVLMAPTATTVTGIGSLITVISANPQTFACRSDSYTWSNGKTGTTQRMSLDVSGNLTVSGDLTVTGNDIKNSGGSSVISMSSGNTTTNLTTDIFNVLNPTTNQLYGNVSQAKLYAGNPAGATFNDRTSQLRVQTGSTSSGDASTIVFNTGNYNTGTGNFSATQAGDTLGEFFFGGNYGTTSSFTTLGTSVRFAGKAAENFTATNSGGRMVISMDKIGGSTQYDAMSIDSANTSIASDTITLESNTAVDYAVFNSTSATFAQPVGFPVKTAAQWNAITGAVGRQVSVSDSPTSGGRMAFWDTTNARWSYISDNSAV